MRYLKFEIERYKGVRSMVLDLDSEPKSKVFTLVGLNESGKTTILEALSFFHANLENRTELTLINAVADNIHGLIPKQDKDNFNGAIELQATVSIDEIDTQLIRTELEKSGFLLTECDTKMKVTHKYSFVNSSYKDKGVFWTIEGKIKRKDAPGKAVALGPNADGWEAAYKVFKSYIPSIIYYPNFLFDFPDKIYLEAAPNESREQSFYRQLLQDVLDSLNNNLSLQTHVLARAKSGKAEDRDAMESVLNKMGSLISKTVFNKDLNIFQAGASRSITISNPRNEVGTNRLYIEMKLKEGEDSYYIRERSLGFRWFFTFLLFTQFRATRHSSARDLIFLFDEPASNLHPAAQQKIMRALEDLTTKTSASVIYSTHSHHLINPKWLETAYIVKNSALDYDRSDDYSSTKVDIVVERYRAFVGKYPTQRNYFQPILDVLDYRPSNLEDIPNVVMLEGKNDFYGFTYFQEVTFKRPELIRLLPGSGSANLDTPIQLYLAWGRNFIILLDDDSEGREQKKRYIKNFGDKVKERIYTYADIDPNWRGFRFEELIGKSSLGA